MINLRLRTALIALAISLATSVAADGGDDPVLKGVDGGGITGAANLAAPTSTWVGPPAGGDSSKIQREKGIERAKAAQRKLAKEGKKPPK